MSNGKTYRHIQWLALGLVAWGGLLFPSRVEANTVSCQVGHSVEIVFTLLQNGQPKPNSTIVWTVLTGTARFQPNGSTDYTSTTDLSGDARATVSCPSPGTSQIQAQYANTAPQVLTLTASFGPNAGNLDPVAMPIANAIDQICPRIDPSNPLSTICANLPSPGAGLVNALHQLAPEEVSAQGTISAEMARNQLRSLSARLADLHATTVNIDRGDDRVGFFINGNVGTGDQQATSQTPGFDLDTQVITAGLDYRVSPASLRTQPKRRFYIGAAVGYYSTDTELAGGGDLETQGANLAAYATYANDERKIHLDGIVLFGRGGLDSERHISFPGFLPQVAFGQPDSDQFAASLGLGRNLGKRAKWFGRVDYLKASIEEYTEAGAPGFNLALGQQEVTSLLASVGAQVSYLWELSERSYLEPMIRLDALHEFEDDSRLISARFVADPTGTPFMIPTEEPDRDFLHMTVGLSAQLRARLRAYLFYDQDLERQNLSFSVISMGCRIEF